MAKKRAAKRRSGYKVLVLSKGKGRSGSNVLLVTRVGKTPPAASKEDIRMLLRSLAKPGKTSVAATSSGKVVMSARGRGKGKPAINKTTKRAIRLAVTTRKKGEVKTGRKRKKTSRRGKR